MQYKYDVAFSFLAQDEEIATGLNDMLQDRVKTFLYSRKQGDIAGTDGEKTFNKVFSEETRLVVVLYRSDWGKTSWTRIEETAIRNRAFDHGYDFVIFIPLEEPPSVPKWLPRTQLWVGIKRWGISGAASVIEARIQELGGEPHEETVTERASRLERSLKFSERRQRFLGSEQGVSAANKEFDSLRIELEQLISIIKSTTSLSYKLKFVPQKIVILAPRFPAVSVDWRYHFANTLAEAQLDITLWNGHPPFPGVMHFENPARFEIKRFTFDLSPNDEYRWVSSNLPKRSYSTGELASFIMKYCMDKNDTPSD